VPRAAFCSQLDKVRHTSCAVSAAAAFGAHAHAHPELGDREEKEEGGVGSAAAGGGAGAPDGPGKGRAQWEDVKLQELKMSLLAARPPTPRVAARPGARHELWAGRGAGGRGAR